MDSLTALTNANVPRKAGRDRPSGRSKRTRNREGKQDALIQSALALFAGKGYEATTTREIAAAAGCAEGLIHRYFKGKAGLLPALMERQLAKELGALSREVPPAQNLETEFVQLVSWEVERFWESRDFLKVFIPRALVDNSLKEIKNHAVLSVRAKAVADRLRRYSRSLTLSPEEFEALTQSVGMLGLIFGFMRPLVLGQDRTQAKQMAITVATMLIRSV